MTEHVNAVMGRYGSRMYAIDVINERELGSLDGVNGALISSHFAALFDNGTYRDSVWYNVLGEGYLGEAVSGVLQSLT